MGILNRVKGRQLYHCCLQKTASRWVAKNLRSADLGISHSVEDPGVDFITDKTYISKLDKGFSADIVSPLYINYDDFLKLKKRRSYRAIWVTRDFRDVMVSQFFSIVYSHAIINKNHAKLREELKKLPFEKAFKIFIEEIYPIRNKSFSYSVALRSWLKADQDSIKIVKYEDLTSRENLSVWEDVFGHYQEKIPQEKLKKVLSQNSFEAITKRKRGEEENTSHLRSGEPGNWKKYFNENLKNIFKGEVNDILVGYGYEQDEDW